MYFSANNLCNPSYSPTPQILFNPYPYPFPSQSFPTFWIIEEVS